MAGTLPVRQLLIAPSILSADPLAVGASVDLLKGNFDMLHVDIMDGHFVPNLSYGPAIAGALRKKYPQAVLDVHLMVDPADDFIDMFIAAKPDYITVHAESTYHLHRVLSKIRDAGIHPGIVLNPGTSVEMIRPVLNLADMVLLMSVNPGFGGQSFIPETLEKAVSLARLRAARGYDFLIEMDGGVGAGNVRRVFESGVDVAVMGSAVFRTDDPAETVMKMRALAAGSQEDA